MEIFEITTQKELRELFWEQHPQYTRKGNAKQNTYPADVRMAWVDFVDQQARAHTISEALADRATL